MAVKFRDETWIGPTRFRRAMRQGFAPCQLRQAARRLDVGTPLGSGALSGVGAAMADTLPPSARPTVAAFPT